MSEEEEDLDVYYRLYLGTNEQPRVVKLQWFDELDYDPDRFLSSARYDDWKQADEAMIRYLLAEAHPKMVQAFELLKAGEDAKCLQVLGELYDDTHQ